MFTTNYLRYDICVKKKLSKNSYILYSYSGVDPDTHHLGDLDPQSHQISQDPDPQQRYKLDPEPDPHQIDAIRNTALLLLLKTFWLV
jgi:hypothetical protein